MSAWPFLWVVLAYAAMLWLLRHRALRIKREETRKYAEWCAKGR